MPYPIPYAYTVQRSSGVLCVSVSSPEFAVLKSANLCHSVKRLCQRLEFDTELLEAALLQQLQKDRLLHLPSINERQRDCHDDSNSRDRNDRNSRSHVDRPRPKSPSSIGSADSLNDNPDVKVCHYIIGVDSDNGIGMGNIVGAVTNEANIDSRYIGQIQLFDQVTAINLPYGMPKDVLEHLKKVRVCGPPLNIREAAGENFENTSGDRKPHRKGPKGAYWLLLA